MANALNTMIETAGLIPAFDTSALDAIGKIVITHEDFLPFVGTVSGYTPEALVDALDSLNSGEIDRYDMTNPHAARVVTANIVAACFVGCQVGLAPAPVDADWGSQLFTNWEEKAPVMVREQLRDLLTKARNQRDGIQGEAF